MAKIRTDHSINDVWIICNRRRRKCSVCPKNLLFLNTKYIVYLLRVHFYLSDVNVPEKRVANSKFIWEPLIQISKGILIVLSRSGPSKDGSYFTALCVCNIQQDFWVKNRDVEGNLLLLDHRTLWRCSVRLCMFQLFCLRCVSKVHILNFI